MVFYSPQRQSLPRSTSSGQALSEAEWKEPRRRDWTSTELDRINGDKHGFMLTADKDNNQ
jgi:hypothetical protein